MTPAERLIQQMRDQRKRWITLEEGRGGAAPKRVQIIRPPETDLADFLLDLGGGQHTLQAELRHVEKYVVGWDGFTEADLVGPAGSSDAAPFAPELWREAVTDRLTWMRKIAQALLDMILEHRAAREDTAKN